MDLGNTKNNPLPLDLFISDQVCLQRHSILFSDAHVVTGYVFNYTIVSISRTFTVTVTGFPATYKNFRDIKIEDIPLIKAGILQTAKVAEPTTIWQKRN